MHGIEIDEYNLFDTVRHRLSTSVSLQMRNQTPRKNRFLRGLVSVGVSFQRVNETSQMDETDCCREHHDGFFMSGVGEKSVGILRYAESTNATANYS